MYYLLIFLCAIILLSYIFDLTARITRIPGVILLILTGMTLKFVLAYAGIAIPDLSAALPIMGTIGLILIVLEGSLDLTINRSKKKLITHSVLSALVLFIVFALVFSYLLTLLTGTNLKTALINAIPLGIISSAVAIPSAAGLNKSDKEFIVYESSFSDIIGILAFDYILVNQGNLFKGLLYYSFEILLTIIGAIALSIALALLINRLKHHVKFVIIITVIVLIYVLAKLIHWPSLLVVLIFGLIMNNNHLFKRRFSQQAFDFDALNIELKSFKSITGEMTFIVRSFFFIMFGYYTSVSDLLNLQSLLIAVAITCGIFVIRGMYLKIILKIPFNPLLFFAPRGLITILLFLSIPSAMLLPFNNKGLITQVIFLSIIMMFFGNILLRRVIPVARMNGVERNKPVDIQPTFEVSED